MKKMVKTSFDHAKNRRTLYVPDEFVEDLGWPDEAWLQAEIGRRGEVVIRQSTDMVRARFKRYPSYNRLTLPLTTEEEYTRDVRIETHPGGILLVKFL